MMKKTGLTPSALLVLLAAVSCGRQQIQTPSRVLDRPSDVAVFCMDYDFRFRDAQGDICNLPLPTTRAEAAGVLNRLCGFTAPVETTEAPTATVLALSECSPERQSSRREHLHRVDRAAARLLGLDPENPCCAPGEQCGVEPAVCSRRKIMALVTNAGRSEVAVVDTQVRVPGLNTFGEIQNLQSGKPGFGFLPVGQFPDHLRAAAPGGVPDASGRLVSAAAFAVTTNTGSCDLSLLRLQQVAQLVAQPTDCDARSCPERVVPRIGDQKLSLRPAWVEIAPFPQGQSALVAFPGCRLVADVDLATGQLREAVVLDDQGRAEVRDGAQLAGLRCPAECGGELGPPTGPVTVAVDEEGAQLLIGDSGSPQVTFVPYDPAAPAGKRLLGGRIHRLTLAYSPFVEGGQRGVDVLRVSPRTSAGKFAYAVSRDATVRVIDLDRGAECETNPDPRELLDLARGGARVLPEDQQRLNLRRLSCLPVGTVSRSPLFVSPGISLPGGALPRDVAFVHEDLTCSPADADCPHSLAFPDPTKWLRPAPMVWIGDFAWILGSNGVVEAVQIADQCPMPSYRACYPEQAAVRRASLLATRAYDPALMDPLLPLLPQALTVHPAERLGNSVRWGASRFDGNNPGPRVETDTLGTPLYTVRIPGLATASDSIVDRDGNRTLIHPAPAVLPYLPVDPICDLTLSRYQDPDRRPRTFLAFPDLLAVRDETWTLEWEGRLMERLSGRLEADGAFTDPGGLYCARGVEPGDKLWLPGCNSDAECPGGVCMRDESQGSAPGLCVLSRETGEQCHRLTQMMTVDRPVADLMGTRWAATWLRRYRIVRAEHQVPGDRGTVDRLVLAEIAQPEAPVESLACEPLALGQECQGTGTHCRLDLDNQGRLRKRCVQQCRTSRDCADGFVCAFSAYDAAEGRAEVMPRCLRAPLLSPQARIAREGLNPNEPARWDQTRPLQDLTGAIRQACFPGSLRYEVRAGDAFLVQGSETQTPTLLEVDPNTRQCRRPSPPSANAKPEEIEKYRLARLRQPRLRLFQTETCPPSPTLDTPGGWILHRLPAPEPAVLAGSCQALRQKGVAELPSGSTLDVMPALPLDRDPALRQEYRLLSSLRQGPRSQGNQCLFLEREEPNEDRIHYEGLAFNLVLRVPRAAPIPPEGYQIVFNTRGGYTPYALPAQVSAGQRAQSLRAAATAPDGGVFIVDQGRLGPATGLRGQLLRLFRALVDNSFFVR